MQADLGGPWPPRVPAARGGSPRLTGDVMAGSPTIEAPPPLPGIGLSSTYLYSSAKLPPILVALSGEAAGVLVKPGRVLEPWAAPLAPAAAPPRPAPPRHNNGSLGEFRKQWRPSCRPSRSIWPSTPSYERERERDQRRGAFHTMSRLGGITRVYIF